MDKITYAYLETTNYCNLDCSFCNRDEVIGPLKHMSLENWGKLLDGIKHHPIEEAKLMGMRSEERRVGKEGRYGRSRESETRKKRKKR